MKKKIIPVGATWKAENAKGILYIWLDERKERLDVWKWRHEYYDGSNSGRGDWNTSYRGCYDECSFILSVKGIKPRFRRIK